MDLDTTDILAASNQSRPDMNLDFYLSHEQEGDRLVEAGRLDEASAAYGQALALNPGATWIATKQKRLGQKETTRRLEA